MDFINSLWVYSPVITIILGLAALGILLPFIIRPIMLLGSFLALLLGGIAYILLWIPDWFHRRKVRKTKKLSSTFYHSGP